MKARLVYHSSTGNTNKLAKAIAAAFEDAGWEAELHLVKGFDIELLNDCNLIGFGTPVFVWKHSEPLQRLFERLPWNLHKPAFLFATYAGNPAQTFKFMHDAVVARGMKVVGRFGCIGEESYPILRSIMKDPKADFPDAAELAKARRFASEVITGYERYTENPETFASDDPGLRKEPLYYVSKMMPYGKMERTLGKKQVDHNKCTVCGTCEDHCPSGCITLDDDGPVFGDGCVGCCACYNLCPEEAITARYLFNTNRYKGCWD